MRHGSNRHVQLIPPPLRVRGYQEVIGAVWDKLEIARLRVRYLQEESGTLLATLGPGLLKRSFQFEADGEDLSGAELLVRSRGGKVGGRDLRSWLAEEVAGGEIPRTMPWWEWLLDECLDVVCFPNQFGTAIRVADQRYGAREQCATNSGVLIVGQLLVQAISNRVSVGCGLLEFSERGGRVAELSCAGEQLTKILRPLWTAVSTQAVRWARQPVGL